MKHTKLLLSNKYNPSEEKMVSSLSDYIQTLNVASTEKRRVYLKDVLLEATNLDGVSEEEVEKTVEAFADPKNVIKTTHDIKKREFKIYLRDEKSYRKELFEKAKLAYFSPGNTPSGGIQR